MSVLQLHCKHSVAIGAVWSSEIVLILKQDSRGDERYVGRLIMQCLEEENYAYSNIRIRITTVAVLACFARLYVARVVNIFTGECSPSRTIYKRAVGVSIGIDQANNSVVNLQAISELFPAYMATPVKRNRRNDQQDEEDLSGSGGENGNVQSENDESMEDSTITDEDESSLDSSSSENFSDTDVSSDAETESEFFAFEEEDSHSGENELFLFNCGSFVSCSFAEETEYDSADDSTETTDSISTDEYESSLDSSSSENFSDTDVSSDAETECEFFACEEEDSHSGENELFLFNCGSFVSCSFAEETEHDSADDSTETTDSISTDEDESSLDSSSSENFSDTGAAYSNRKPIKLMPTDTQGRYEFQHEPCTKMKILPRCVECYYHPDEPTKLCRFWNFRKVGYGSQKGRYRFPTSGKCYEVQLESEDEKDESNSEILVTRRQCTAEQFAYTLFYTRLPFSKMLKAEKNFRHEYRKATTRSVKDIPLRLNVRYDVLCDVCLMAIFNLHTMCRKCGFCVCMTCFSERLTASLNANEVDNMNDDYLWYLCTDRSTPIHYPAMMELCYCHDDLHPLKIDDTVKQLQIKYRKFALPKVRQVSAELDNDSLPDVEHCFTNNGKLLILKQPYREENIAHFRKHWRRALPIVVQNVKTTSQFWRPSYLRRQQGNTTVIQYKITDCSSEEVLTGVSYSTFWDGFENRRKRIRNPNDCNTTRKLKLQNWPRKGRFAELLPSTHENFYSATPMSNYVDHKNAPFNLVLALPDHLVKPDLDLRLCIGYEMFPCMDIATTNLHSDINDSLNILTWTSIPKSMSKRRMHDSILHHLAQEGLDEQTMNMARERIKDVGALWTVYKPSDSEKIRRYINSFSKLPVVYYDPIHDGTCYLNATARADLVKRGVQPIMFLQMRNDAVFIPAGAAHQVLNLQCCVTATLEFISPEGINRSLNMLSELQTLTFEHINRGDQLQIRNIIYYSSLEAIEALEKAGCPPPDGINANEDT
ncbi:Lysine-specific demethylase 3A [Trichinella britovi]|uniref:Lysine-specific demethylase 3A n=1 Tax=Trichinella britovi TaxID=45882 RepID=A0A0V1CFL0_TRIBR|nr:Lysine-specific demethylase 3A [Trichinella britovi]